MELQSPNALSNHRTTTITTTTFRIFLILASMGIYVLINQSSTPTTINTITMLISGIIFFLIKD